MSCKIKGNETPMAGKMMWNAKDMPIWDRAAMKLFHFATLIRDRVRNEYPRMF
jgi:hypothetical protein